MRLQTHPPLAHCNFHCTGLRARTRVSVGVSVGVLVRDSVGDSVGVSVGDLVGDSVGDSVGNSCQGLQGGGRIWNVFLKTFVANINSSPLEHVPGIPGLRAT